MSGGKTVIALALAILVGILAVIAATLFLGQNKPAPVQTGAGIVDAPVVPSRKIVVPVHAVAAHSVLEASDLKIVSVPLYDLPANHVTDLKTLIGRRVAVNLKPDEPLLEGQLVPYEHDMELAGALVDGYRAMTVPLSATGDVSGFVMPGNRVDVLLNSARGNGQAFSRMLLQNVKVLAIAQERTIDNRVAARPVSMATLEVTPSQAEILDMARSVGTLSFTLRAQSDRSVATTLGARQEELHGSKSVVEVIRGTARSYE